MSILIEQARTSEAESQRDKAELTGICLDSSIISWGYFSNRLIGLLKLIVNVNIPGLEAPLDSMYSDSLSELSVKMATALGWFATYVLYNLVNCRMMELKSNRKHKQMASRSYLFQMG